MKNFFLLSIMFLLISKNGAAFDCDASTSTKQKICSSKQKLNEIINTSFHQLVMKKHIFTPAPRFQAKNIRPVLKGNEKIEKNEDMQIRYYNDK